MLQRLIRKNVKRVQDLPNTRAGRVFRAVRWTGGYAPWPPLYVELALTYRCNLDCPYCYQDARQRTTAGDMTIDGLRRIERGIRSSFRIRPRLYLFGGEPTLHPDFLEILEFLAAKGYNLSLTTNGILLESNHLNAIAHTRGIDNVVVSLNSANLDSAASRVGELVRRSAGTGMTVSLNCPVDLALEVGLELTDIADRFDGCGARYLSFQHSQSVFLGGHTLDADDGVRRIRAVHVKRYDIEIMFFPHIKDRDLHAYYADPRFPHDGQRCVLPWFDVLIRPNGDVIPCDEVDVVMGNAQEQPLGAIWNGESFRAFRRSIGAGDRAHPVCRRCCHRQYYG